MINQKIEESLHRAHRSQSVMSSVSLQDSQLQFYDAIEDFSESDTGSDSGSEQESEIEAANESVAKSKKPAIVPGNTSYKFDRLRETYTKDTRHTLTLLSQSR